MSKYVLDASAVLAVLNQEAGSEKVVRLLSESAINAANYCEVLGKLVDAGVPEKAARESLDLLGIELVDLDQELACIAAGLRPKTRAHGLSLGDRCCLALGLARRHPVITADRSWADLNLGLKIALIR